MNLLEVHKALVRNVGKSQDAVVGCNVAAVGHAHGVLIQPFLAYVRIGKTVAKVVHALALEKLTENPGVFICNLGTGKGYSVLEIVTTFNKV